MPLTWKAGSVYRFRIPLRAGSPWLRLLAQAGWRHTGSVHDQRAFHASTLVARLGADDLVGACSLRGEGDALGLAWISHDFDGLRADLDDPVVAGIPLVLQGDLDGLAG